MKVIITIPQALTGDIIGDLDKRNGELIDFKWTENTVVITAEIPRKKNYERDIKILTKGAALIKFD